MKELFQSLWRGLVIFRRLVGMALFYIILIWLLAVLFGDDRPTVPGRGALVLQPEGALVEQLSKRDSLQIILREESSLPTEVLLRDIVRAVKRAKDDKRIVALVLRLDLFSGIGPAEGHYLAGLIDEFKESGKPVLAYGRYFTQSQYLIASRADKIYLDPQGSMLISGYGIYPTYYREGLEKLKAKVHVFRVGDYKSAGEPYLRDDMSPEAKEANSALLNVLWDNYVARVSEGRGLEPSEFLAHFDHIEAELRAVEGDLAELARAWGLVDELMTRKEWQTELADIAGPGHNGSGYSGIDYENYLEATDRGPDPDRPVVAVVVAEGTILDGEQASGSVGGETVARLIRKAARDEKVVALVLRVNSPGGSVFASEIIRREVALVKAAGKPIIASMGDYGASGGYWISLTADEIWAQPTTITGSIGIFALFPTIAESLDAIGVHVDGVGTTALSGSFNPARAMDDLTRTIITQTLEKGYEQFITLVAAERKMSLDQVREIARGRVWAGKTAVELGLVDELGNLEDATLAAARRADISEYETIYFEDEPDFATELLESLFVRADLIDFDAREFVTGAGASLLAQFQEDARLLLSLNDPGYLYAICDFCRINP